MSATATEKSKAAVQAVIDGKAIDRDQAQQIFVAAVNLSMCARDAERCAFFLANEVKNDPVSAHDFEEFLRRHLREVQQFLKFIGGVING